MTEQTFGGRGILSGAPVKSRRIHDPRDDIEKWREAARQFSEIVKQSADRVVRPDSPWTKH